MERKAYKQLLEWKNNPHHKPLILNGARQVGKTWLLKHFGEKEYKNVAYVNCDKSMQMKTIFGEILIGSNIFSEYKGTFTELYVLQQMETVSDMDIYYFSTDDSRTEIDFVVQHEGVVTPIEVKAEENLRAKSLRQIVTSNTTLHGLRFSMSNYRQEDWLDNVPLYGVEARFVAY